MGRDRILSGCALLDLFNMPARAQATSRLPLPVGQSLDRGLYVCGSLRLFPPLLQNTPQCLLLRLGVVQDRCERGTPSLSPLSLLPEL